MSRALELDNVIVAGAVILRARRPETPMREAGPWTSIAVDGLDDVDVDDLLKVLAAVEQLSQHVQ